LRPQAVTFEIPADRWSAIAARRAVAATVELWGLAALRADAELVVSELVSNAMMHAPGPPAYMLHVEHNPPKVRLTVTDASVAEPAIRPRDGGRVGGQGLRIVAALASAWGVQRVAGGKQVWAEFDVPPLARHGEAPLSTSG